MKKLRVEFFPKKCIGNRSCVASAPDDFSFDGEKAVLRGGKNKDDLVIVEREYEDPAAVITAGMSCPVNAIKITDCSTGEIIVSTDLEQQGAAEIRAEYDDATEFVLDPAGYFLIRVDAEHQNIEVAFCTMKNKIVLKVVGKKPIDIYHTIIVKNELKLRPEHYAYLGRELQKAYTALQKRINYVQDDELIF